MNLLLFKKAINKSFILLVIGHAFSFSLKAQSNIEKIEFGPEYTEDFIIRDFSGRLIENTIYFKFLIIENIKHTAYILEYSYDGKNFNESMNKEGYLSPQKTPLLYCYKLNTEIFNSHQNIHFRIKRLDSNKNDIDISRTLVVNIKNSNLYVKK